jgi:hypothetical protein
VGDEIFAVRVGATLLIPDGATRGMPAQARLAFIAVRIDGRGKPKRPRAVGVQRAVFVLDSAIRPT